ncbi:MAG: acyltransferase, partial [Geobacteraceae bacterium]|nr:acyltransferase [Geobacteraceae bacterium]
METKKVYFPNLNGVRFIAALMVIIQHTEEAKIKIGFPTSFRKESELGEIGVTLFFVLSGFLITYLLQSEKLSSGTISLQNFYTRRILRIWPLYFLIILLGFWIIPDFIPVLWDKTSGANLSSHFSDHLLLDIFFMPNAAIILFPPILYVSQIWSIGVEEQFYLLWPLLMKYFGNPLKPLIVLIVLFIGARAATLLTFTSLL